MRLLPILIIFTISLLAESTSKQKQLEKEFEFRFQTKKTRSNGSSIVKDNFLSMQKFNSKAKSKKYRNFPLPPLPPIEGSEDTPPSPPGPDPTPTPENNPSVKDNVLSDYKGKYEIIDTDENGNMTVKFSENVAIRKNGIILKLVIDPTYNYHAFFDKEEKLASSFVDLAEPVKAKVGKHDVEISNWVSFNSENGNINFLCPAGDNLKFQIGNNTVKYSSTSKEGYSQKIFFYQDGSIESIHIRDPHTLKVGSVSIQFTHHEGCGGDLDFYQNGALKGGYLAKKTNVAGIDFPKESYIGFYESGKIMKAAFPNTTNIQGYKVGKIDDYWPEVEFYENGKIKLLKGLAQNTTIDGKKYRKGQTIQFKEDGTVDYAD